MLSSLSVFSCGVLTVTFVITAHVLGDCPGDTGILRLYKELGCKAVKSDAEKCPISFSCPKDLTARKKPLSKDDEDITNQLRELLGINKELLKQNKELLDGMRRLEQELVATREELSMLKQSAVIPPPSSSPTSPETPDPLETRLLVCGDRRDSLVKTRGAMPHQSLPKYAVEWYVYPCLAIALKDLLRYAMKYTREEIVSAMAGSDDLPSLTPEPPEKYFKLLASAIQTPSKTCSVKGKTYTSGEKIPTSKGSCVAECRCTEAWPNMDRSSIVCAHIDCPEFLGEPIMDGCVRQYSLDACCSVGVKCPSVAQEDGKSQNATPTAAVVAPVSSFMCNVSGVLYPEGSVFYPDAPACTHCICTKDFTGSTTGPYCREISCDIELHYASDLQEGCTPVYFGDDGCCPIQFRCPSIDDTVVKSTKDVGKNLEGKEGQCTFGNLTLSLGDRLSPAEYEECVDCSCQIPPYVSCTKLPNC